MDSNLNRVHIIAMGGSVMHALAIALQKQGVSVTGSDDEFLNPSRARLEEHGLLPEKEGWFPDNIDDSIDIVLLGMHAHKDNTELVRAQELNLTIQSYPEFIHHLSEHKQRIVIAGSHGKTTITSMIMHVLKFHNRAFDYVVGAKVKGFDETVKISDAPVVIIEGDEYLSSRIDPTPKFLHYNHHIGLISGIAWDHVNVFPTEDEYVHQFDLFADATPKAGSLVYNDEDVLAPAIGSKERTDVLPLPYTTHQHEIIDGVTYLINGDKRVKLKIFGKHNLLNLSGAKAVLARLSITKENFYDAIKSFELPSLRLNVVKSTNNYTIFRDYAHAPSKVEATAIAVKSQFPDRDLVGVFELHTYSSLNKDFFSRYANTLKYCNEAIVYYNPKAIAQKKLATFEPQDVKNAFKHPHLTVVNDVDELQNLIAEMELTNKNVLLMSSANFGGLNINKLF
jgi:UDP-N-acetylmuramate: L-alanyl-gamma-D-glutamyl-meso-diaminopimelate ligase